MFQSYSLKVSRIVESPRVVIHDMPNEERVSDDDLIQSAAARMRLVRRVAISIPDTGALSTQDVAMMVAQLVHVVDGGTLHEDESSASARGVFEMAERIRAAING